LTPRRLFGPRNESIMKIEELIVGILLVVAIASYGTLAAITLLT
jgi:hypothetical protein